MDPFEQLPPAEPFVPFATIFKLDPPGESPRNTVRCLSCGEQYPLTDLLEGELNDDQCPECGRWALDYWRDKIYRSV
jgi:DNA-directed RNA polymerase subunit RPC12/RpoP